MVAKHKRLKAELNGIKRIEELYEYRKSVFVDNSSEKEYANMLTYIETTLANLQNKLNKAPIGHKYTGTLFNLFCRYLMMVLLKE